MKKVALMTWFQWNNYGTALQAVAMTRVLNHLGFDVDGVDYVSSAHRRKTKLEKMLDPMLVATKAKRLVEHKIYSDVPNDVRRSEAFRVFREKHLNMTEPVQTSSELYKLNAEYDAFICGSDQIWAPTLFDPKYYLDFVAVPNKMIAYGPSFGMTYIQESLIRKRISENVERFEHLSVREEQGAQLLKEICNVDARVVLDPTLLLSAEEWDNYLLNRDVVAPYILCYFLGDREQYWQHVDRISKQYSLEVLVIPIHPKDFHRGYGVEKGVGPAEFISLVKNATLVCTDSFHGTIFSILYQRPFLTYKRFSDRNPKSQNSRVYNLLGLLNMQDRIAGDASYPIDDVMACGFGGVLDTLSVERKKSIGYLKIALHDACQYSFDEYEYEITNTCCGCSICMVVCSQNAITVEINPQGFFEANVDRNKCIRCGLCRRVCAFNGTRGIAIDRETSSLYMFRSKSDATLRSSSSGGASYEISKLLSMQGYDVIGCTYDKQSSTACHKRAEAGDIESLAMFQGSKYIQSNTVEAFVDVLSSDRAVIFGTPCQIAGLSNLLNLKGRRDDYVLVDLICHGLPSIHLWHRYLEEGDQKYGYGGTPEVQFRYKPLGWMRRYIRLTGNGKEYVRRNTQDLFYRYFELMNCYMPSCYECNYRVSSKADLRIGDYWGRKYEKYRHTGASMVIALTLVGNSILKELQNAGVIELVRESSADYWSVQATKNPLKPLYYDELISEIRSGDVTLGALLKKYSRLEELNKRLSVCYGKVKSLMMRL